MTALLFALELVKIGAWLLLLLIAAAAFAAVVIGGVCDLLGMKRDDW